MKNFNIKRYSLGWEFVDISLARVPPDGNRLVSEKTAPAEGVVIGVWQREEHQAGKVTSIVDLGKKQQQKNDEEISLAAD